MYSDYQIKRMAFRFKALDGLPYEWGLTDCFSVLNDVYDFAGLPQMDRGVVLDVLGDDKHASKSQITQIVDRLTIPAPSFPDGGILILTSNDVSYGTGLLVKGEILLAAFPRVRVTTRSDLRRCCKIVGCYKPACHK